MNWLKLAIVIAAIGAAVAGWGALKGHYIAVGDQQGASRVQGRWDAQTVVDQAESLRLAREANADQLLKFRNSERNTDEQALREAATARRDVAARAAVRSLRSTIETLNQRDAAAAAGNARAAALAGQAAFARELFGRCTEAYRELAAAADGLRDQVTGLLADAHDVCRKPRADAAAH